MEIEPEIENQENQENKGEIGNALDFQLLYSISIHKGPISCVRYSPNGSLLAVSSTDKLISVYDTKTQVCKYVFEGHDKGINTISWSPDSHYLASCSDDKTIRIWNCDEGKYVRIIDKLPNYPTYVVYNPRGTILACSCDDNHIYFFSVYSRTMVKSIYAHSNTISTLEFDKTGHYLLSSSVDGYCRIWECESGNCLHSIRVASESTPIVSACYSPNDQYVAISCADSSIYLWCLACDTIERVFTGHHHINKYLCDCQFYVYNQPYIVTGSENGCLSFYSINSQNHSDIHFSEDTLFTVAVSPSGEIAVGTIDGENKVYVYKPK